MLDAPLEVPPEITVTSSSSSRPSSPALSIGGGGLVVDWVFAQHELLQNTGYDIGKEIEEKERQFEIKEKLFETRCYLLTSCMC